MHFHWDNLSFFKVEYLSTTPAYVTVFFSHRQLLLK